MRFTRFPRWMARSATPRRLAHSKRAIDREAEKTPLFAEQIRARETPEERLAAIDAQGVIKWRQLRDFIARQWRTARRAVRRLPESTRQELLAHWNSAPYPGSSEYFADFVRHYGKLRSNPAQIPVAAPTSPALHAPPGTPEHP